MALQQPLFGAPVGLTTPDSVARRRALAQSLLSQGVDSSPVGSWTQGAARLADALVGGIGMRKADAMEQAGQQHDSGIYNGILDQYGPSSSMGGTTPTPVNQPNMAAGNATMTTPTSVPSSVGSSSLGASTPTAASGPTSSPSGPSVIDLLRASQLPWLNDGQRGSLGALLQQKLAQTAPVDAINVNGRLVNPRTGALVADYSDTNKPVIVPAGSSLVGPDGTKVYGGSAARPATAAEKAAYGVSPDTPLMIGNDGEPQILSQRGTSVNVNNQGETAFAKSVGDSQGKMFSGISEDGIQAGQDLATLGRLRDTLKKSGSGLGPGLKSMAAGFGINLGAGADDALAANSIISYLAPRQRVAGTGASSDRDVAMFKQALPSLLNTPGGNGLILDTMEGMARYKQAQGDIANDLITNQIDQKTAIERLKAIPDPFAAIRPQLAAAAPAEPGAVTGGPQAVAPVKVASPAEAMKLPSGTPIILPDGSQGRVP